MNGENESLADLLDGAFFPEPSLFDERRLDMLDFALVRGIRVLRRRALDLANQQEARTPQNELSTNLQMIGVLFDIHCKVQTALVL